MIRSPAFLRTMSRLALLAVLLVALAPSISRVLATGSTHVLAGWSELCTTAGQQWVDNSTSSSSLKQSPQPDGNLPMGADCDYCPLATALTLALLFIAMALPHARLHVATPSTSLPQRAGVNLRGLGSQGPPAFF